MITGLKQQLALFLNKSYVLKHTKEMKIQFKEIAVFYREIEKLRKEKQKYISLCTRLYEDLKQGIITEEDFKDFHQIYETQYQSAENAIRQQENTVKELFKASVLAKSNLEKIKSTLEITELNRDVLVTFINRILVYEDKRVFCELRAKDIFANIVS